MGENKEEYRNLKLLNLVRCKDNTEKGIFTNFLLKMTDGGKME